MFDFGLRLKELRERKKFSQDELAYKLNKSKSVISGYENNVKTPPIDVLTRLALLYNVSLDYLVGIEKKEMVSIDTLSKSQKDLICRIILEFENLDSSKSKGLSENQQKIINSLLIEFLYGEP